MLGNGDVNNAFCGIALAENRFSETGYREGYDRGKQTGWLDGFDLGMQKGSQIGSEVAFYKGFVETAKKTMLPSDATDSSKEKY